MAGGNDTDTIFLLQAQDGNQWTTTLVDSSAIEHSLNASSDARTVDEANGDSPKFGNSCIEIAYNKSVLFDGESADAIGTSELTVDGWFYFTDVSGFDGYLFLLGAVGDDNPLSIKLYNNTITFEIMETTVQTLSVSSLLSDDTWHHIAAERDDDGQCYIFIDGDVQTQVDTSADSTSISWGSATTKQVEIRGTTADNDDTYAEEVRFSKTNRYGGEDFTPETTAYDSDPSGPVGTMTIEPEIATVTMEGMNLGEMTVEAEVATVEMSGTVSIYGSMSVEPTTTVEMEAWTVSMGEFDIDAEASVEMTGTVSIYASMGIMGLGSIESSGVVPVVGSIELEASGRARLVENVIFGSMSVDSYISSVEMEGDVLDPVFGGIDVDVIAAIKMNGYIAVDEAALGYTRNQCSFSAGELSAVSSSETELGYSRTSSCG